MSFLSDIASLAKAGYTPQDVKDLMQLNKATFDDGASPQPGEPTPGDASGSQPTPGKESPGTEPDKSKEIAPKASAQPADETDYKALYEAEQEKLKALQNKNTQADISGNNTTNISDLVNVIRDYC